MARVIAEIAIASIGGALLACAVAANQRWLDTHFLPSFFLPRQWYVAIETLVRVAMAALGVALALFARPRIGRFIARVPPATLRQSVADLFAPMDAPVIAMCLMSAEMAKHALNSFLAASVSFINEIATLCELTGADVLSVVEALKTDPRIGRRAFLSPGFGFAGGTLARDVQILKDIGRAGGLETPFTRSIPRAIASVASTSRWTPSVPRSCSRESR